MAGQTEPLPPSLASLARENYARAQALVERLDTLLTTLRGAQPRDAAGTLKGIMPGYSVHSDCTATGGLLEQALNTLTQLFGVAGVSEAPTAAYNPMDQYAWLQHGIQSGGVYNNGYGTTGGFR